MPLDDQFVIWTRYVRPTGTVVRHVFGPYSSRSKALSARKRLVKANIEYHGPGVMDNVEITVTKMIPEEKP